MLNESKIVFNHDKLRGLMREKGITQEDLAEKISISKTSLSLKLNSKVMFSPKEMLNIQKTLDINDEDFKVYFFTALIRKNEQERQTA
ncbi:hypothetical protein CKN63_03285 [Carnobacterium divergens]|uniref:Uncharacterized protein n=1 Tax=Carnobacterium divergens TaxID=2748 RepID=A0A7Z8G4B3_CARDV|nr:DUF739 family protein [Carnobacterium divergens]TFI67837.1 hypothetical protein CKN59_03245 [Carnobacterium divergens]TFI67883.1 hypothetical protein CKN76_03320 [Carnobacterium divergens]TFI70116.1 hypothetical protein CKN58_11845 [Carnobacterium divergens]TFI75110.1 hypothetical protein CKN85_11900 [Carnobacterium divergens]TFI80934.1 hypothetical protein CKN56_11930 [Carnobacterium divergens]